MIDATYVTTMAAYNRWQNHNLYGAAATLSDADRKRDCGAFFRSIQGTFNHLLWADEVWMGRLSGRAHPVTPIKTSGDRYQEWEKLHAARAGLDADIIAWAETLDPAWLAQSPTTASGGSTTKAPRTHAFLVVHMFNHQTHHRGQVHAMLTAAGAHPSDDTDLLKMKT